MIEIDVSTGFGLRTNEAYVQILIEKADWMTQMDPQTARELAINLLGAAEAAETDAFIVSWIRNSIGVKDDAIMASILQEFRDWREKERPSE